MDVFQWPAAGIPRADNRSRIGTSDFVSRKLNDRPVDAVRPNCHSNSIRFAAIDKNSGQDVTKVNATASPTWPAI